MFLFATTFAESRYLSFNDGYVNKKTFKEPQKTITSVKDTCIEVEYVFDGAYFKQVPNKNEDYLRIYMDNAQYVYRMTTWDIIENIRLPYFKDLIVLPDSSFANSVKITILNSRYQDFNCPFGQNRGSLINQASSYGLSTADESKKDFKDVKLATIASYSTFRTIPFTTINTYPVWFDSQTNTLRCYSYIKYRISFSKKDFEGKEVPTKMNKLAYNLLSKTASNPDILTKYDTSLISKESNKSCEYLIVTKDEYKSAAEKLATWKSILGYKCHIFSKAKWESRKESGNPDITSNVIREYCNKTLKCMPDYLLIIGSDNDIQAFKAPYSGSYCSDSHLSRITQSSQNDEMIKGRISVYSLEEANNVVDKIIAYEKNPPLDKNFYDNVLAISYLYHDDLNNYESKDQDFFSSSEGVSVDLEKLGYTVTRHALAEENSIPQYFVNGEKMPESIYMKDASGNEFWNKDEDDITNLINKGKLFVTYRGHGHRTEYSRKTYTQDGVDGLKNGNKTPIFFNFTCSTGEFFNPDLDSLSFAEYLLNKKNGGAVGVYANSEKTIHGESANFFTETFRLLFKNQDASIASSILQASLKEELDESRNISHWFGDPSMKLYTVAPASFNPTINIVNDSTLSVACGVKGAKLTVCSIADMGKSYYKTFDYNNNTIVSLKDVNVPCYITITKTNYVPYVTVSRQNLDLQNMSLNGFHDIVANKITTGKNVTNKVEEGAFVVESGETNLTSSKAISLKSGTSIKNGSLFKVRIGEPATNNYSGKGGNRSTNDYLCFTSISDRFNVNDIYNYESGNVGGNVVTSITDNSSNSEIVIYPNPTSGYINVVANDIKEVSVMDIAGNTLIEQSVNSNNVSLDLSSFAKGMYLVKVVTAEDSYIKKVVLK